MKIANLFDHDNFELYDIIIPAAHQWLPSKLLTHHGMVHVCINIHYTYMYM